MQALIIGSKGQLGLEMQKKLKENNIFFDAYTHTQLDITDMQNIEEYFVRKKYSFVVNCAAYTNVDKAESNYANAYAVNAKGAENIAKACNKYDADLFHISTDYVFSGEAIVQNGLPRPYVETDKCDPQTAYGKTKLIGEELIRMHHDKSYILRTAWLYGSGSNFVKTMLRLAADRDEIRVVADQFGSPTSATDLANAIISLIDTKQYDTYHATCEGICTWYDFAKKIFELNNINIKIIPITSEEFICPAKRPKWSVLENTNLKQIGKNNFPLWQDSLKEYVYNFKIRI
jgi:dTDP-4-dehydrorhamnose reductase